MASVVPVQEGRGGGRSLPGQIADPAVPAVSRADYVTPFAVNATVSCFRYDGRVAPQQIARDGELVSVEKLRVDTVTQRFLVCYEEARGLARGLGEKLEIFTGHLSRVLGNNLPSAFDNLLPIILTVPGKRRPFTPAWITGLPLRIEGVSKFEAEDITCVLATSLDESMHGIAALALGRGVRNSLACTISLFPQGFCDVVAATIAEEDSDSQDPVKDSVLFTRERQLLVLGPLLNFRKAVTGMLTPQEFRSFSHSFVNFLIVKFGMDAFLAVMAARVPNKAKEKEDTIMHLLDTAMATTIHVDMHEVEDQWTAELFDRHKDELMQNKKFGLLPEEMKAMDCFASTAVGAVSDQPGPDDVARLEDVAPDAEEGQETPAAAGTAIVTVDEPLPQEEEEEPPRDPTPMAIPLKKFTAGEVLLWTVGWVYENERSNYTRCLMCILYMFVFAAAFPSLLLVLFDEAVPDEDWALLVGVSVAVVVGLAAQAQAEYLLKSSTPSGARFIPVLQLKLAKHMVQLPQIHLDACSAADFRRYTSVLENDVPCISKNIDALFVGLAALAQIVGAVAALLIISPIHAAIILLVLPLFYLYSERVARVMASTAVFVREFERKFIEAVDENFARSALKKVLGLGHYLDGKLDHNGRNIASGYEQLSAAAAENERGMQMLGMLMTAVVLIVGALLVALETVSLGELLAFYVGSATLSVHVVNLTGCIHQFSSSCKPLAKVLSVLTQEADEYPDATVVLPGEVGLEVNKVTYHGMDRVTGDLKCLLRDVTLNLTPGQKIALVGDVSGTTPVLIKLCTRLYRTERGSISVNGVPIENVNVPRTFAVVDDEPLLFEGSVLDNIRIGSNSTAEQVTLASTLACLHEEVMEMESGYDSPVGFSGEHVSLMMRQRIVLARALARRTPVLLMDQPLSMQDPETLSTIGKNLSKLRFQSQSGGEFNTTVMVATNNLEIVKDFDVVVALKEGQVAEYGSPEELIERRGTFWTLFAEKEGLTISPVSGRSDISVERLRRIWPFAHCMHDEALEVLINNIVTKYCLGQETLHTKGTSADSMLVLIKGTVQEFRTKDGRDHVVRQWQAGEVVGVENLVVPHNMWSTTAVSAPGAVVAMLKRHFFQKTIDSNTYLRFGVRPTIRQMALIRSPLFMSMMWPFMGLSNQDIDTVNQCFHTQVIEEGTRLFQSPGEPCRKVYVVVTGAIIVRFETYNDKFKRSFCQRSLGPGSILGAGILLGNQCPDLHSARAKERSIVLTYTEDSLENSLHGSSKARVLAVVQSNASKQRAYVSADHLVKNWLLCIVPKNVLSVLATLFRTRVVAAGGLIMSEDGGAADTLASCIVLVRGRVLVTEKKWDGGLVRKVLEEGSIINEVGLVGDPVSLGYNIVSVEAEDMSIVASCSRSTCLSVLATLGIAEAVRELAERRAAVSNEDYLRQVGFTAMPIEDLATMAMHSTTASYAQDTKIPRTEGTTTFVILQGTVRVIGGRVKVWKDMGAGESFTLPPLDDNVKDTQVEQAEIRSAQAVLYHVTTAHSGATYQADQEARLKQSEKVVQEFKDDRSKLAALRHKVHLAEIRLGLRANPSVRYKWRKALMLIRTAEVLGVTHRLSDHLRSCFILDGLRSVVEEVAYLNAYHAQLSSELGRREELFNEKAAVFRRMGHTVEDAVVLDDDMFDMTFERIDKLEPQMEALRAQRMARIVEKKQLLEGMWTRMRTPPAVKARTEEALVAFGCQPEAFHVLEEEETAIRAIILKATIHARNQLRNLWPVLKVAEERRRPFLPDKEPFPTIELLDVYEEEVRKLLYATEVFKPIEFDPVKFHLALQCRGLREEIGLPPGDDDPLERTTEQWDREVIGLQRVLAERNCDRGQALQKCHTYWSLLGTPDEDVDAFLAQYPGLRADTIAEIEAESENLKSQHRHKKKERFKLIRQLRRVWATNEVKIEDQDRFLQHHDGVHPKMLEKLKGEIELQKAITVAREQINELMHKQDTEQTAVTRATEVLHNLQTEERQARVQATQEFEEEQAQDGGEQDDAEEDETKEMKVMKQMEELARIRRENAVRLAQSHIRGLLIRRQMAKLKMYNREAKRLWGDLDVDLHQQQEFLKKMSGLKLSRRLYETMLMVQSLKFDLERRDAADDLRRKTEDNLKDQKVAFEVFARVVVIWEKIGVPDDERKTLQDMMSMPCAELVRRLRQEERTLKEHMEHERQKAEQEQSERLAAIALAAEQARAKARAKKKEMSGRKGKKGKGKAANASPEDILITTDENTPAPNSDGEAANGTVQASSETEMEASAPPPPDEV